MSIRVNWVSFGIIRQVMLLVYMQCTNPPHVRHWFGANRKFIIKIKRLNSANIWSLCLKINPNIQITVQFDITKIFSKQAAENIFNVPFLQRFSSLNSCYGDVLWNSKQSGHGPDRLTENVNEGYWVAFDKIINLGVLKHAFRQNSAEM